MSKREWPIFVGLVLLAAIVVSRGSHAMTADAAHYLAVTHSIAHDFDLDLRNQYSSAGDYLFADAAAGPFARSGRAGRLYPSDGLAFSAAMVPVFVTAETVATYLPASVLAAVRWNRQRCARDLISFAVALLYAWVAVLTLRVVTVVRDGAPGSRLPIVLAFASPPLLFMSILAVTEIPAAFLCAWFLVEQARPVRRPWMIALPLALLPWLQVRYVLLASAGVAWVLRENRRDGGRRPTVPALPLVLASLGVLAAWRWWMFGTIASQGSPDGLAGTVTLWLGGVPGLLVDRDVGLLWVAPFWLAAIIGAPRLGRRRPDYVRFAWTAFLALWLLTGLFEWSPREVPPGRLLVPVLPILAALFCEGFSVLSETRWRWLAYASVGWAVWVSAVLVERPARMFGDNGEGIARIPQAVVGRVAAIYSPASRLERMGIVADEASFIKAAREGNLAVATLFLQAGFPPGPAEVAAVKGGHADMLALLLSTRAGLGPDSARALAWATHARNDQLTRLLTAAGAHVNLKDSSGQTALIASARRADVREVDILVASGADLNATTTTGQTALTVAIAGNHPAVIQRLLAAGAGVNGRDADGWTPLMLATRLHNRAVARQLIAAHADVNAMSRLGWNALMWAAYEGQFELVRDLITAGADVNASSKAGQTALIRAAGQGHLEIARTLLAAGADPGASVDGADAHDWATRSGHAPVVALLDQSRGGRR